MSPQQRRLPRLALLTLAMLLAGACRAHQQSPLRTDVLRSTPEAAVGYEAGVRGAQIRWELAEFLKGINARDVADLQVRYGWDGDPRMVEAFWKTISSTAGPLDLKARLEPGWDGPLSTASDANRIELRLVMRLEWSNGAGGLRSQQLPLAVTLLTGGGRSWISIVHVQEQIRW